MMYEMGTMRSSAMIELMETKKLTVAQIADMRKGAIEFIDSVAPGYYNLSLLDYHRKLIKSGHWEAYNMWLMSPGAEEETNQWADSKRGGRLLDEFASWFVDNLFAPSDAAPTVMTKVYRTKVYVLETAT